MILGRDPVPVTTMRSVRSSATVEASRQGCPLGAVSRPGPHDVAIFFNELGLKLLRLMRSQAERVPDAPDHGVTTRAAFAIYRVL